MEENMKPGGGNKLQPYIPEGNGEKSGEYTDKPYNKQPPKRIIHNCFIRNVRRKCNFKNSKLVGRVDHYEWRSFVLSMPTKHRPNTVIKRIKHGFVVSERYYNDKGEVYLDIDYTCHGNPHTHPVVPHIHIWTKNKETGQLEHGKWEDFR